MKIVIDIPEEIYTYLLARYKYQNTDDIGLSGFDKVGVSIKNGTPLPKNHGRLIDADELKRTMEKDIRKALSFVDLTDFVWLAPTIIEADKEE